MGFSAIASLMLVWMAAVSAAIGADSQKPRKPVPTVAYGNYDPEADNAYLRVNDFLLVSAAEPREFQLTGLWRYDLEKDQWIRVKLGTKDSVVVRPKPRTVYSRKTDRVLFEFSKIDLGLYWTQWKEDGRQQATSIFAGPTKCNDIMIGEPPNGKIAACVPLDRESARAIFVPDPRIHCRERR